MGTMVSLRWQVQALLPSLGLENTGVGLSKCSSLEGEPCEAGPRWLRGGCSLTGCASELEGGIHGARARAPLGRSYLPLGAGASLGL